MATPNYGYEKRQRELAKKRKKEEKALRKSQGKGPGDLPDHAASEPPAADPAQASAAPEGTDPKPSAGA